MSKRQVRTRAWKTCYDYLYTMGISRKHKSVTVDIEGAGPVLFERSKRARRVIISVKTDGRVRVAVPPKASLDEALEFVKLKKTWIVRHLKRMRRREAERKQIASRVPEIDRDAAKKFLVNRLHRLADAYGFTYNRVTIRNQRTLWGSCSAKNNISLNMKLVLLPEDLRDYVLLHELVHTREHNHSKKFWQELDRYVGNGKALAAKLRKVGFGLLGG